MFLMGKLGPTLVFLVLTVYVFAFPTDPDGFSDQGEFDAVATIEDEEELIVSDNPKIEGEDEENFSPDLMYSSDLFQGDIVIDDEQKAAMFSNDTDSFDSRTGILGARYRWPKNANGNPIIPYTIDPNAGYTRTQLNLIQQGMRDVEKGTCIRFIRRTTQRDYVQIHNGRGCSSRIGRIGNMQLLSLKRNMTLRDTTCMSRGTVIHELVHAIGYDHMHNHADRNRFVTIRLTGVPRENRHNFDLVSSTAFSNFQTPYDYLSIMHYRRNAFTNDGSDSIIPIVSRYLTLIGNGQAMSRNDTVRVNRMYGCRV